MILHLLKVNVRIGFCQFHSALKVNWLNWMGALCRFWPHSFSPLRSIFMRTSKRLLALNKGGSDNEQLLPFQQKKWNERINQGGTTHLLRASHLQEIAVAYLIYTSSVQIIVSAQCSCLCSIYWAVLHLQGRGALSPLATVATAVKLPALTEHSLQRFSILKLLYLLLFKTLYPWFQRKKRFSFLVGGHFLCFIAGNCLLSSSDC